MMHPGDIDGRLVLRVCQTDIGSLGHQKFHHRQGAPPGRPHEGRGEQVIAGIDIHAQVSSGDGIIRAMGHQSLHDREVSLHGGLRQGRSALAVPPVDPGTPGDEIPNDRQPPLECGRKKGSRSGGSQGIDPGSLGEGFFLPPPSRLSGHFP